MSDTVDDGKFILLKELLKNVMWCALFRIPIPVIMLTTEFDRQFLNKISVRMNGSKCEPSAIALMRWNI